MSIIREDGGRLVMVVGMQYGSEGKGAVASYLAPIMSMGVRTGASNAGHTIYYKGTPFVMHQLPCAWVNPVAQLVLGIGAMISLSVLREEIALCEKYLPVRHRLYIDRHAHVITEEHIRREGATDLATRIGSTSANSSKGIGAATAAKVMRDGSCVRACDVPELSSYCVDTVDVINSALDAGQFVFLEGTQGFGLSVEHGHYPYTTSRDTTATALAASVGVSPHAFETEVIGVTRTYPIRVAGNSGPFGDDAEELSWKEVTRRSGSPAPLIERTSVTKNVRRVATFSMQCFEKACRVNRPSEIALTFADYLDWSIHGKTQLTRPVEEFIERIEAVAGVPVTLVGTGPQTITDYDDYRRRMLRKLS